MIHKKSQPFPKTSQSTESDRIARIVVLADRAARETEFARNMAALKVACHGDFSKEEVCSFGRVVHSALTALDEIETIVRDGYLKSHE